MEVSIVNIIILLASFFAMEAVAWLTHKYIMHGLLWSLHKDHHEGNQSGFEKNDFFFVLFAIPGASLLIAGISDAFNFQFYIGAGITLYGCAYFLIHDIFIHQRFPFFRKTRNKYLLALRRAHKIHHKRQDKLHGSCFGMLIVPKKYFTTSEQVNNLHSQTNNQYII